MLAMMAAHISGAAASSTRIMEVLDAVPEIEDKPDAVVLSEIEGRVAFENVTFSYGPTLAVEDISLTIERGDFVAMIGPNGSGKTTLVKLALGLEHPQQGHVSLFGQDIHHFHQWHRVGYVPQSANAFQVRFPATVGEAPVGLESTGSPVFCTLWTLCGMPAISLPMLEGAAGMPLGVQLVGPRGDDARLLRTARWLAGLAAQ